MKVHELKITPMHFTDVIVELKNFEVRYNDRDYQVGDVLVLKEWDNGYTGKQIKAKITYILRDFEGLKSNYIVMNILIIK